jgi:hypothetical protein
MLFPYLKMRLLTLFLFHIQKLFNRLIIGYKGIKNFEYPKIPSNFVGKISNEISHLFG